MDSVEIYTDGACKGNPGPGGWGALLRCRGKELELKGFAIDTTNNRMELTAAIEALQVLSRACEVELYTDSTYLRQGMLSWLKNWKQKNWRSSSNQPIKNVDLWKKLDTLASYHKINWHWVKGHSGHPENERVDELANQAILEARQSK